MRILVLTVCLSLAAAVVFAGTVPPPLAVSNAALGGGPLNQYTPGVTNGKGLHNIGLLVRCWGYVTAIDSAGAFFYIDDGSGVLTTIAGTTSTTYKGIRVAITDLAPGNTIAMPTVGQFLVVTGISSTSAVGVAPDVMIIPTLRPRKQSDVTTL